MSCKSYNPLVVLFVIVCFLDVLGPESRIQAQTSPEVAKAMQESQSLVGQGNFAGAEKLLRPMTEKFPSAPGPWFMLGYCCHAQKKFDEALAAYEKSKTFPATKARSFYNIACVYSIQGKADEAFAAIDSAIKAGFSNYGQLQSDTDFNNIKDDPRFANLQPKWLPDSQLFVEKSRIIHKWSGENAGDQFGWTARRVGDIDQDGVTDFIATAPTYGNGSGKIYVYSSKSGKLIHEIEGEAGHRFGNSAVGVGDVNEDGVPDFIVGAPNANNQGAAFVYSGKDASIIHTMRGATANGQFGYEVSETGDIDGDDVPDFLVGEFAGNGDQPGSGRAIVYSGKTVKPIFELKGEQAGDRFGNAAAVAAVAEDEFLLAIGAQNAGESDRGRVYVYHIKNSVPKLRFTINGDANSVNLGQMFISFPGDIDGDGVPDVYASDFSDSTKAQGGGKVIVHSGVDGKELLALFGHSAGEGLGTSPSDAGDVDGDGIGDLIVGAWQNREGAQSGGRVYLYSTACGGKLLRSWTNKQSGDTLGFDACGIGDVDGDGNVDFLLTAAWSNKHGAKTGRVFIVAGESWRTTDQSTTQNSSPAPLIAGDVSTVLDDIDGGTGGLNIDARGNLYTADFGSKLNGSGTRGQYVYKVSPEGKLETFCDQLVGGSGNTFDSEGNLFQSSIRGGFISKIDSKGKAKVFAKGFRAPVGLVFDKEQNLFVCNCGGNLISKVTPDGESTTFCQSPLLKCPNGITIDPDGQLYVCNFSNGDVITIDQDGVASRLATLPGRNNGHLVYHEGYLYVIARMNGQVYRVDLAGNFEVFIGSGKRGKDDGKPLECSLSLPNSLIISHDKKWMYINETSPTSGDHNILSPTRIRKVELGK